jgi:hypothetical protein
MNAETLAALERLTSPCRLYDDQDIADAALIRALIQRERSGGERAQVLAYGEMQADCWAKEGGNPQAAFAIRDCMKGIAYGAHEEQP